jgi:hypothetical protein
MEQNNDSYTLQLKQKGSARFQTMAVTTALAVTVIFAVCYFFRKHLTPSGFAPLDALANSLLVWAPPAVGLAAVAGYLLRYLDRAPAEYRFNSDLESLEREIKTRFKEVELNSVNQIVDDTSRQRIVDDLKQKLFDETTEELLADITASIETSRESNSKYDLIQTERLRAIQRLVGAIDSLRARANVNLVFGIVLSVTGISILGYTLSNQVDDATSWTFLSHYAPRIALVLVVEIFSYFFLNLYRANLAETRYYHNEITNVEARFTAMTAVHISGTPDLYGDVVRSLLTTERNGILLKGQTTVELARASIEFDRTKDLTDSLISALSALAGKKDKV